MEEPHHPSPKEDWLDHRLAPLFTSYHRVHFARILHGHPVVDQLPITPITPDKLPGSPEHPKMKSRENPRINRG
jgi:hypothetical protein